VTSWLRKKQQSKMADEGHYDEGQQQQQYDPSQAQAYAAEMEGGADAGYSEGLPEVLYLMQFCAQAFAPTADTDAARAQAYSSWEPVREWLHTHSPDDVREAAEQRDDVGKTALHFACQHVPPTDIIDTFLNVAGDIIQWPDSFGWLPIHYACAYDAEPDVIKSLAEAFPESKTTVDRKGRTPLHFFLGTLGTQSTNSPDVVVLLSNTGAASYPTDEGLLPLHLACAFGRSEATLYVLTDAYPDAVTTVDNKQRTPLHFVLSNAGRKSAPAAVRLLLSLNTDLVNAAGGGPLPLLVLAQFATTGINRSDEEQLDAVQGCLRHILSSRPKPTPEFFSALQRLPTFLRERAVVMKAVQEMLNDKIAQRFPTMILILDFYMQFVVLITYMFGVTESQRLRKLALDFDFGPKQIGFLYDESTHDFSALERWLVVGGLYGGAFYFLLREVFQAISLAALGAFHIYVRDLSNWLNILYISLVVVWATLVLLGEGRFTIFVYGTSLSVLFLITKLLAYLKNVYIDFAIFSGGVLHVLSRLSAFIFCLIMFLVAFSRFFVTLFQESTYCDSAPPVYESTMENETERWELMNAIQCDSYEPRPWCDDWSAILSVYTMLLGEVDETKFIDDEVGPLAVAVFALFMFLIVILLANVLIAIVTDSYKVIQDQRAAIVFWTNRLDFIAQMDAVANGPWKRKLRKIFGLSSRKKKGEETKKITFGQDAWKRMMDLLFEEDSDVSVLNIEFYCYFVLRVVTALIIVPTWFLLGIVTFGILWPPQIRAFFFTSKVTKASESDREDALRKTQIESLHVVIQDLKNELLKDLAVDRTQVVQLKSSVAEKKLEIQNEMKHIKRVVTMLFEQQSGM
jgi:ankyrin repeat protein